MFERFDHGHHIIMVVAVAIVASGLPLSSISDLDAPKAWDAQIKRIEMRGYSP
jgi:hypothetical protein